MTYPNVKQIEKAIPTKASDFERVRGVVTSLMIALRDREISFGQGRLYTERTWIVGRYPH